MRPDRLFRIAVVLTVLTCVETSRIICDSCGVGKYSGNSGAINADTCQPCTGNSTSDTASDSSNDCSCIPGFSTSGSGDNLICTIFPNACAPGSFLENNICKDCLTGTFKSDYGAHGCNPCQTHSTSVINSINQNACFCNAGYSGENTNTCTECAAGKFKESSGNVACVPCGAGKFSTHVAATSDTCQACKNQSTSPEASNSESECLCNAGYSGENTNTCIECVAGKFKESSGNVACVTCGVGKYSV